MKVIITAAAFADLDGIFAYIAQDNPKRANSFVTELQRRCYELSDLSEAFAYLDGYKHYGMRRRVYEKYSIIYRMIDGEVWITHIVHASRKLENLLSDAE